MRKVLFRTLLAAGVALAAGCGGEEPSGGGRKGPAGSDEVKREVGEALEATKDYLAESTARLKFRFDEQMKSVDEGLDEFKRKSAAAGEKGKEYRERILRTLEEKKTAARGRMEDLRGASGELRAEAEKKLEAALRELEEAYEQARRSFEDDAQ